MDEEVDADGALGVVGNDARTDWLAPFRSSVRGG